MRSASPTPVTESTFFLVLARNSRHIAEKIAELEKAGFPYIIVSGERFDPPNVVFRPPRGKYDAINHGAKLLPKDTDTVVLNDVDTKLTQIGDALSILREKDVGMVFAKVLVNEGPQVTFNKLLDRLRSKLIITANGELMFIPSQVLRSILPLRPSKAEDTYIMFKILRKGLKVIFSENIQVETRRTNNETEEMQYKRRTTCGIYQALSLAQAPLKVRLFYGFLPLAVPCLAPLGRLGLCWIRGIILGVLDYLRGDRTGLF